MSNELDKPVTNSKQCCDQRLAELYERAFSEFGVRALWNMQKHDHPTVEDALAITRALRTEGNMAARRLAEQIESLARANH